MYVMYVMYVHNATQCKATQHNTTQNNARMDAWTHASTRSRKHTPTHAGTHAVDVFGQMCFKRFCKVFLHAF